MITYVAYLTIKSVKQSGQNSEEGDYLLRHENICYLKCFFFVVQLENLDELNTDLLWTSSQEIYLQIHIFNIFIQGREILKRGVTLIV